MRPTHKRPRTQAPTLEASHLAHVRRVVTAHLAAEDLSPTAVLVLELGSSVDHVQRVHFATAEEYAFDPRISRIVKKAGAPSSTARA
jgi:hypothetical protein